jgi:hypothetical protein
VAEPGPANAFHGGCCRLARRFPTRQICHVLCRASRAQPGQARLDEVAAPWARAKPGRSPGAAWESNQTLKVLKTFRVSRLVCHSCLPAATQTCQVLCRASRAQPGQARLDQVAAPWARAKPGRSPGAAWESNQTLKVLKTFRVSHAWAPAWEKGAHGHVLRFLGRCRYAGAEMLVFLFVFWHVWGGRYCQAAD